MPTISAVIITYNEERNISRCIDSLEAVADEVIVVDSFSTDRTRNIAAEKGAKVVEHTFEGHIEQKNYAWEQAASEYVLSLDADEELSDTLRENILSIKDNMLYDGYSFNRKSNYCGKWINHSGWYPDVKTRLFKKGKGKWGGTNPHDKYVLDDPERCFHLDGDLLHYTFYTVQEHREQVKRFTNISSQAMYDQGRRANIFHIIFSPMAKFIRNYIIHKGYRDGYVGLHICTISAYATYLKYMKLMRIQNKPAHLQSTK